MSYFGPFFAFALDLCKNKERFFGIDHQTEQQKKIDSIVSESERQSKLNEDHMNEYAMLMIGIKNKFRGCKNRKGIN